jgi:hypothetical protein
VFINTLLGWFHLVFISLAAIFVFMHASGWVLLLFFIQYA